MQFNQSTTSARSTGAVDNLLRRFSELPKDEQDAFMEALIRKERIQRIMNLVAKSAQAKIEGIRDP